MHPVVLHTVEIEGASVDTRHFINGERVESPTAFTNTSPIDGRFLGEISRGGAGEVDAAVSAARGRDDWRLLLFEV